MRPKKEMRNRFFRVLSENERYIVRFELINHNKAKFFWVTIDEKKSRWCVYREVVFLNFLDINDVVEFYKSNINLEDWFSGQIIKRFKNGNVALILNFKDGKLCGINKGWFENTPAQLHFKVDVERGKEKMFYERGQTKHLVVTKKKGVVKHNSYYENGVCSRQIKYTAAVLECWAHFERVRYYRSNILSFPTFKNIYDIEGKIKSIYRPKGVYFYEKTWDDKVLLYIQSKRSDNVFSQFHIYHGVYKNVTLDHSIQFLDIYKNNKKRVEIFKNNRRVIFSLPNTPKGIVKTIKIH
jgi:antitoxin component YwqK of YwqJK toxin-antitoxin module